ncbi:MAG: glycosyltransferase family 4 protein [Armatimonadota bacterium]
MNIAMLGAKSVPAIGGIAHYVEEVGAGLVARGHTVTVYCRPHYLQGEGEYRGMRRVVTRGVRGKHLDALTHTLSAAVHAAREGYDVVHIHGSAPGMLAGIPKLLGRKRVLVTIHALDWRGAKWSPLASALMRAAGGAAVRCADGLVAVSECVAHEYARHFGCAISTIPTGVSFPELVEAQEILELGLQPGRYIFCASRLMPEKGVHHLIDAFEGLDTDMKLAIAGNAPYEDDYTRRLLARASDRIIFLGFVQGRVLAELYSNAYLYVQPSELEGMSMAVLEALSYGRCVVASDIEPNREALGPCGYTFECGNVEDLRAVIARLLARPEVVSGHFAVAREFIRTRRSWDQTVEAYEQAYDDLLAGRVTTFAGGWGPVAGESAH